ncbi:MAG: hypothetical protein Kow00124_12840 [Anaerolineae bacterium]
MLKKTTPHIISTALLFLLFSLVQQPALAYAQPVLVDAVPAPGAVLDTPPAEVRLTFDRIISNTPVQPQITVTDERGERVHESQAAQRLDNLFAVTLALPPLPSGVYTVSYQVQSAGSDVLVSGSYQFSIVLPPPDLVLLSPIDGQWFESGDVPVEMQVTAFDFNFYNNRIHLYVDGEQIAELRELTTTVAGLEPGVHQIKVVLAQLDAELPQTARTATIAVAAPGSGDEQVSAPPLAGWIPTGLASAGIMALALLMVWVGVMLGRQKGVNRQPQAPEGQRDAS